MNHINVQSYYDGSLFQYSKEEKEGFVKHVNSKDKVSYRKYFNKGITGVFQGLERKNNQYLNNREELEFVIDDGEDRYHVTFPVMDNDGTSLDRYAESIVTFLGNLEKGQTITINNWRMNKGDTVNGEEVKYTNMGVSFKDSDGNKIERALSYQHDGNPKGDIPQLEWRERGSKKTVSAVSKEKRLDYLYDVLLVETERLAFKSENSNNTTESSTHEPSKEAPKATPKQAFVELDKDQDLPF